MTLSEFKAWLEGYGASFKDDLPNADQWAEIKRRLDGVVVVKTESPSIPTYQFPPHQPLFGDAYSVWMPCCGNIQ